jgi:Tol biopolymer transport system component
LGLALLFAWWRVPKAEDRPLVRLDADFGDISFTSAGGGSRVVISPDGGRLVYMMAGRLYTQRLDQLSSAELKGTEGAGAPFFSPDGRWVGFFAQGKLKKISVEGGAAITLCNSGFGGGSWGDGGTIIATTAGGLYKVPDTGGVPTPLTKLAQGEATHRWPQILPGSKAALFTSNAAMGDGFDAANVEVVLLKNGQRKTLVRGGTYGRYIPAAGGQGHLIYANQGTLFAAPFDLNQMEVRGTPVPVLQGVSTGTGGAAQLDFSRGGTLVYRKGSVQTASLTWLDSAGAAQPLALKPAIYSDLRLSPDGQRLALSIAAGANRDIWDYEWQRDTMTRLTFGGQNADTVWSPDGRYLVFASTGGIFWTRADGAGKRQPLMQSTRPAAPYSFTPDGKRLAFSQYKASELGSDLWTAPVEQDAAGLRLGKPEIFLQTPFRETTPAFSPDGHWLAYGSDESGNSEVYVRAFPDRGGRWQISNGGGSRPLWSRNGRELIFQAPAGKLMVASYAVKGDSFAADKPRGWFSNPSVTITQVAFGTALDVTPDGKRVVSMKIVGGIEEAPGHLTFLINFADELRRRSQ